MSGPRVSAVVITLNEQERLRAAAYWKRGASAHHENL